MSNDIYCDEILSGHLPVKKVFETDRVLAFYSTRPRYPVHILVVPKKHILSLVDIDPGDIDILHEVLDIVRQAASKVTAEYGSCGVLTNVGDYQTSKHMHWHVTFGEEYAEP